MASMRATLVRAAGWLAASRSRNVVGRSPPNSATNRRSAVASGRPKPIETARWSAWNSLLRPTMLASMLLSSSPLRNTQEMAVSTAATERPRAVMAEEWLA